MRAAAGGDMPSVRRRSSTTSLSLDRGALADRRFAAPADETPVSCPPSAVRKAVDTLPYLEAADEDALPLVRPRQTTLVEIAPPPSRSASEVALARVVGEIERAKTSSEAAMVCAHAVSEGLQARTVIVFSVLEDRSNLRVIGGAGEGGASLLGEVLPFDGSVGEAVLEADGSLVLFDHEVPARLRARGAPASMIAVPILARGRRVGVIAVVDPAIHEGAVVGGIEQLARHLSRFFAPPKPRASAPRGKGRRYAAFCAWLEKRACEKR